MLPIENEEGYSGVLVATQAVSVGPAKRYKIVKLDSTYLKYVVVQRKT